jgi:hypothetical protein
MLFQLKVFRKSNYEKFVTFSAFYGARYMFTKWPFLP